MHDWEIIAWIYLVHRWKVYSRLFGTAVRTCLKKYHIHLFWIKNCVVWHWISGRKLSLVLCTKQLNCSRYKNNNFLNERNVCHWSDDENVGNQFSFPRETLRTFLPTDIYPQNTLTSDSNIQQMSHDCW